MSGTILLLLGALILRAAGAAIRAKDRRLPALVAGWIPCTVGVWMAAGAVGAWFPLWPALVLGAIGALCDPRMSSRQVWIGADIFVLALCGFLSIPPLNFTVLAGTVLAVVGAGFIVDFLMGRCPKRVRATTVTLPFVACVTITVMKPSFVADSAAAVWDMFVHNRLLHLGVTPPHKGERVVLSTGAVAWLDHPHGKGPFPGALFFHGAHRDASRQPAAIVARRALVEAGFMVLAVDHPGYGDSPTPSPDESIDAWDPLPTALAALKALRSTPRVDGIIAVGHSMGATEVLRLLAGKKEIESAALFGAGGDPSRHWEFTRYWYRRFHTDRKMSTQISPEQYQEIFARYYLIGKILNTLDEDHAPILFVRFEIEHQNIVATRDLLYERIPGRKKTWDFAKSTHYFASYGAAGIIVGDTRITRLLASHLAPLASRLPAVEEER